MVADRPEGGPEHSIPRQPAHPDPGRTDCRYTKYVNRSVGVILLLIVMVAAILALDVLLLRDRFWLRLATNIGIVAVAGLLYATLLRH